MKAVMWGYVYADMKTSWQKQFAWLVNSFRKMNIEVKQKDLQCEGVEMDEYNPKTDNPSDICVYNHCDISCLIGNVLKADHNWFMKPTVPDEIHTTLDTLGYGPFSSISFNKPTFEKVSTAKVKEYFENKVKGWIDNAINKWGSFPDEVSLPYKDYWLVLGQCGGDSVNTRHDFGDYFTKLKQVVTELSRISPRDIVVKLHPHMDGKDATDTVFSDKFKAQIEAISPKVHAYNSKCRIHNFIAGCRAVILGNSGAGFEAMMHHKPIISWGKPEYHWITYDLRYLADLCRAIKLDWFDAEQQDKFLCWYTEDYCYYDQKSCDRRVKELLAKKKWDFDGLWRTHRPAQGYTEFKEFIELVKGRLPAKPLVLEIGLRRGDQRHFYQNLFGAEYRGIDITKFDFPEFIHGDSGSPETLDLVKKWLNGRKIDLLFIDGDHKYESVKRDYELYSPLSKMVALHDIQTTNSHNAGVPKFWKKIKTDMCIEIVHSEPGYGGDGIGIICQ